MKTVKTFDMQAVITADIVNSTKLDDDSFQSLLKHIKEIYSSSKIEFYRGDSFQVLVKDGVSAFTDMLMTRLVAISTREDVRIDIRQSMRLGKVKNNIEHLGSYVDDTFLNSGRNFDKFEKEKSRAHLLITCGIQEFDFGYEIIAEYLDTLLSLVTPAQAIALYYYFRGGFSQKEIAESLGKSAATISKQIKLSRIEEIQSVIDKYEKLTKALEAYGK